MSDQTFNIGKISFTWHLVAKRLFHLTDENAKKNVIGVLIGVRFEGMNRCIVSRHLNELLLVV